MVTSNFEKFRLLLWKNWILQWNHKSQLIVELLLPALFAALLVQVRTLVVPEDRPILTYNNSFPVNNLDRLRHYWNDTPKYRLTYSPNSSPIFEKIIKEAAENLNITYSGYASSKELETVCLEKKYLAGIDFGDSMAQTTAYPDRLAYRIRFPSELRTTKQKYLNTWLTNMLFVMMDPLGPRNRDQEDGGIPVGYLREGFLAVQYAISTAFITQSATNLTEPLPEIELQRYPYPAFIEDPLLSGLAGMMALILILSYIYPCTYTVRYITSEKEHQLKEVMKIMGLQNWLHWTAWFVKGFVMMGISSLLITIIITIKWSNGVAVLTYSSFTAVFFFFLIYTIATVTLCFMLATFFSKASTASAVTGLLWFIIYIPYTFFQINYSAISLSTKLGFSLLSNTAMGLGLQVIMTFEAQGEGLQWSNMFSAVSADDSLAMGHILGMLLLSSVIYMIICLYMEQIFPGDFGVPKKWYFPFTKSFWVGEGAYVGREVTGDQTQREDSDAFEVEPTGKNVGLQIKDLSKTFGDRKAVNSLSLSMYEDEITVLLGHNGAGKTTTISMLTGMFPPTSGTAVLNGSDIRTNMDGARMSLGICPQHNILFDDLTVRDHLVFYSRLKGLKGEELEAEVTKYIKKIDLEKKANVASSKLSGGMKRKLSVCAAFCGGTKVVLCDEPSSGMDPAARRQLWDLLQSEKSGRTVLLTTHFMDEADVLGDRIAIMSAGELKCMGTSFFLKKKFGSGYRLICVRKPECVSTEVTKLLSKYIPDIQPEAEIGAELAYQLSESYCPVFEEMFQDLETHSDELGLNGYGIGVTSLEEVFMKVGAEKPIVVPEPERPITNGTNLAWEDKDSTNCENMFSDSQPLLKGSSLMVSQWRSMIMKKYLCTLRSKLMFAIQNLMPILFIAMTFIVSSFTLYADLVPMTISLTQYKETVTILETTSNVGVGSLEQKISDNYERVVSSSPGANRLQSTGSQPFIDFILELGKSIQFRINSVYIAAATVDKGKITAWLNNKPLHSAPLTLNLIQNAMARAVIGPQASIVVTNDPLPFSRDTSFDNLENGQNIGVQISLNLCFCMCFVSSLYVLFLVKENQSRAKLLQFVSGVNVMTFWCSHFLWDIVTYIITALIVVITLACFQEDGYASFVDLGRYFVIMLLFGFAVLPFTYLLSGLFSEPSTGFSRLSIINIFGGVGLYIIAMVLSLLDNLQDISDLLNKIFPIFPHYGLIEGLSNLYVNQRTHALCEPVIKKIPIKFLRCRFYSQCCKLTPYFGWEYPGVLREIVYFIIAGVVFFAWLIFKEYRVVGNLYFKLKQKKMKLPPLPEDGYFDEDVEEEKKRISNMLSSEFCQHNLVIDRMTKFYGRFVAVNQISVAVQESECFGLLGVNGAGKTTTFKMLTGDERISGGDAYVKGLGLKTNMNEVYQEIGYCPQFDALLEELTGRETLKIFALLRGIPENKIPSISLELTKSFGFMKHYDKPVKAYSGGNKRKLSTALAVMGTPSVVYLDEPTSGMDPAARRQLWNMVCKVRDAGKSIVLTSHSMEECEALCTRLAIMVNGEFKCLGSTQHLKNKFTKGLILKIKLKKSPDTTNFERRIEEDEEKNVKKIMDFVKEEFPEAYLQERFHGILTFYIPLSSILWSKIFGLMEGNKDKLNIEDYSVTQTTLEEIFLQFAKYQRDDPREIK